TLIYALCIKFIHGCLALSHKYSRYFNTKYCRKGRLGERNYFSSEINGIRRLTAMLSYVNRQGLHHGLCETAFEYEHCSSNVAFQRQLGKAPTGNLLPDKSRYKYLSSNANHFTRYRMASNGLLLREDVIDVGYIEEVFITPKNYLYNMRRYSDEKWLSEQKEENMDSAPVTLEVIEKGVPDSEIQILKANEFGRVDYSPMRDNELCNLIDKTYLPRYFKDNEDQSIYLLKESKRAEIGNRIWMSTKNAKNCSRDGSFNGRVSTKQLKRCLILP
ncbi:MAG: hypothetical protein Q4F39_07990, partial [Bacteroidia bacterium]|nr:hypothetical protein [Bacteroidia bacterium]